jgi:hypothetical protein
VNVCAYASNEVRGGGSSSRQRRQGTPHAPREGRGLEGEEGEHAEEEDHDAGAKVGKGVVVHAVVARADGAISVVAAALLLLVPPREALAGVGLVSCTHTRIYTYIGRNGGVSRQVEERPNSQPCRSTACPTQRTYMGAGRRGDAGHRHNQPRESLARHHGLRVARGKDGRVPKDGRLCVGVAVGKGGKGGQCNFRTARLGCHGIVQHPQIHT